MLRTASHTPLMIMMMEVEFEEFLPLKIIVLIRILTEPRDTEFIEKRADIFCIWRLNVGKGTQISSKLRSLN